MLQRTAVLLLLLTSTLFASQKVVVVVDDSGSMADRMRYERVRKITAAKNSLRVVLEKLPKDAHVGVLALNRGWLIPVEPLNRPQLQSQIDQLRPSGGTPLGMRMKEAMDKLLELRSKDPYGDFRLLVVTDGEASDREILSGTLPDIMSRNMVVDVIGVDMESEHSLATQVTNYRRADDPESLESAIADSLAESDDSNIVGGQSDFELLSMLDVDIAPFVLNKLTETNNEPITEAILEADGGNVVFQPNYGPSGGGGGGGGRGGGFRFSGIFCMIMLFVAVSMISSMFKQISRPSRTRRW